MNPDPRDAGSTLDALSRDPEFEGRLVFDAEIPERAALYGSLSTPLSPALTERVAERKLDTLWSHQACAIDALRSKEHTVVATGTASGKSLCYQLPILNSIINTSTSTSLLLFPTKALAQDQLRSMRSWLLPGVKAVTYDGDTPQEDRTWARRNANVVLTNPEMLHMGILPSHARWATFLMRLDYVVVDELHALRGIFGGHVSQVLRRLRRICAHYGSSPTFCFTSATIGNPAELASTLIGSPVGAITDDGSPASAAVSELADDRFPRASSINGRCQSAKRLPLAGDPSSVMAPTGDPISVLASSAGLPIVALVKQNVGEDP